MQLCLATTYNPLKHITLGLGHILDVQILHDANPNETQYHECRTSNNYHRQGIAIGLHNIIARGASKWVAELFRETFIDQL
jgi:hypothetical protein